MGDRTIFSCVKIFIMKKVLYLIIALMLTVVACKKDSTSPDATPKNIAGVYRITALTAKAGSASPVNVYNQLTQCQQNDTWGFQEDGTFLFGGVANNVCQDGDYSGRWSLNNKSFSITAEQNTTLYQLESFDGRALVLSTAGTLNGNPATYFVTFTK